MKKLAFIYQDGLGTFIKPIIKALKDDYDILNCAASTQRQIDRAIGWADMIWFEFCNEVAIYGTSETIRKPVIIRLHSYEVFSDMPRKVNWESVDKLIFVAPHIKEIFTGFFQGKSWDMEWTWIPKIIPNGIDVNDFEFDSAKKIGNNIAMIANINDKKNFPLALQIISVLNKLDRYKLHIAGEFQDLKYKIYLEHMIKEMGIQDEVIFHGYVENISQWIQNKDYILSTSTHEGHSYGIMEGMAAGCKPILHNYYGAEETWTDYYLFNTVDDACNMILDSEDFIPKEYRKYIEENYSFDKQIKSIKEVLNGI